MTNLTITVDEEVLKRARIRALERGTSVNAILREFLEAFSGGDELRRTLRSFVGLAREADSGSGPDGRTWARNEIHER